MMPPGPVVTMISGGSPADCDASFSAGGCSGVDCGEPGSAAMVSEANTILGRNAAFGATADFASGWAASAGAGWGGGTGCGG